MDACAACGWSSSDQRLARDHVQGGANAGHTIYNAAGTKFKLHLVPSGILNPGAQCVVGNGVVVHLPSLLEELATLRGQGVPTEGRLVVSERAHLLFDLHKVAPGLKPETLKPPKFPTGAWSWWGSACR